MQHISSILRQVCWSLGNSALSSTVWLESVRTVLYISHDYETLAMHVTVELFSDVLGLSDRLQSMPQTTYLCSNPAYVCLHGTSLLLTAYTSPGQ